MDITKHVDVILSAIYPIEDRVLVFYNAMYVFEELVVVFFGEHFSSFVRYQHDVVKELSVTIHKALFYMFMLLYARIVDL
jgi:hypothetical protein